MKTITVMIPTYNEEGNIVEAYNRVTKVMSEEVSQHNYKILFVDNYSKDNSRKIIRELAAKDPAHVTAIFNAKNFGYSRSLYYGLTQVTGDCAILLHADLQNPPEIIPEFVKYWDEGYKVVIGIKNKSKENKIMYFFRSCYYKLMTKIADIEQIEHFTEYELLDQEFLDILRNLDDSMPYLRGIVSEFGYSMKRIYFTQERRERGKSFSNLYKSYDFAMLGITSYSKVLMRLATFFGFGLSCVSIIIAAIILIQKLINWNSYNLGIAAIGVGVFLLGSAQLFFIGLLGEYILNINTRVMHRPLVVEECRLNLEDKKGTLNESELYKN